MADVVYLFIKCLLYFCIKRRISRHAVSVCLSVRPSVRHVHSVEMIKISSKKFHRQEAHHSTKRHGDIPTGTP